MLVAGFPSAVFGTNVYVVAPEAGGECIVVDPGMEVVDGVDDLLREHRLTPVAVLLTHGHLDHTFSVVPVAGSRGIPAYIHPDDRELLADPMKGMGRESAQLFGGRLQWQEPDDVALLDDGAVHVARRPRDRRRPRPRPHARARSCSGCRDRRTPCAVSTTHPPQTVLSGDVLFAGSIGRTDLPGGSHPQMLASLRDKVLPLDDDVLVLPGHGNATTIGRERVANPYLGRPARARCASDAASLRSARLPGGCDVVAKIAPLSGFPELLPARAHRRAAGARHGAPRLRAARLRVPGDPCRRTARPAAAQGRDRQRGVRPAPAAREPRATIRPADQIRATSSGSTST